MENILTVREEFNKGLDSAVASWLVRSTLDRVVQVQALAGVIVLCS